MQVALVGEAGGGGGRGDRLAGFEQAAGGTDAVGDLQRVGRQSGPLAEQPDQAELADAGFSGELFEADVALRPIAQVVAGQAQRPVVAGTERRSRRPRGRAALDQRAQPLGEPLVAFEPRDGGLERRVQSQEGARRAQSRRAPARRRRRRPGGWTPASPASAARSPTSTTIRRDDHGRPSTAAPACAADGSQATSWPGRTRRRSRPRRERIGCPATIPKTYSPRGSIA